LLKERYPKPLVFDLLLSDVFERLQRNPSLLREIVMAEPGAEPVIIDEIQRIPALLNEVQWLTVNFTNIASDCGVSSPTVREYFQILEETMIGRFLPSFQKKPKRRVTFFRHASRVTSLPSPLLNPLPKKRVINTIPVICFHDGAILHQPFQATVYGTRCSKVKLSVECL